MKQDKIRIIIDEIFRIVIIHVVYFVELIQRIRYKQKPNLHRNDAQASLIKIYNAFIRPRLRSRIL